MNLIAALRRTSHDDLPAQPSDDDLIAWVEDLRNGYEPRRRRQLVAAPAE